MPPDHLAGTPVSESPLAEAEVRSLPAGTPITVLWSGGNGPHGYRLVFDRHGSPYAARNDEPGDPFRYYNPLTFIGTEPWHTKVWRTALPDTPATHADGDVVPHRVNWVRTEWVWL